jgi:hypothetical protein
MPTTTIPNYSSGLSTTTTLDAGTFSERQIAAGLSIPKHDYISFSPSAAPSTGNQTITYKTGGAGGTTVATLTLAFVTGNLASVTKS